MSIIKPFSESISLTTANTVSNAICVYISTTASTLVTVSSNTAVVRGSFVVPANQYILVEKLATDTITANVAISATRVAYKN